jgi:hypothetical protein
MEKSEALDRLAWCVPRALLDEVTPDLVSVAAGVEGTEIRLLFYFDRPITEDDVETASVVGTEVTADFTTEPGWMVEEACYDIHEHPEDPLDIVAYKRRPQTPFE